jgi:dTDP-4-amino-4,6-dideoxygalactose transaminase
MKVNFFDYPLQFKIHKKEYMNIIKDVLSRGHYILCEELKHFEENLAQFVGANYAVGVGNCTEALLLSLVAAGIGPGDEVITVAHTFVATAEVIKF